MGSEELRLFRIRHQGSEHVVAWECRTARSTLTPLVPTAKQGAVLHVRRFFRSDLADRQNGQSDHLGYRRPEHSRFSLAGGLLETPGRHPECGCPQDQQRRHLRPEDLGPRSLQEDPPDDHEKIA